MCEATCEPKGPVTHASSFFEQTLGCTGRTDLTASLASRSDFGLTIPQDTIILSAAATVISVSCTSPSGTITSEPEFGLGARPRII